VNGPPGIHREGRRARDDAARSFGVLAVASEVSVARLRGVAFSLITAFMCAMARVNDNPDGTPALYFTKYQFSGLMDSVDDCGRTPLRLFATSVSWKAGVGCHSKGSCFAR
jgi:hypothetical protein